MSVRTVAVENLDNGTVQVLRADEVTNAKKPELTIDDVEVGQFYRLAGKSMESVFPLLASTPMFVTKKSDGMISGNCQKALYGLSGHIVVYIDNIESY